MHRADDPAEGSSIDTATLTGEGPASRLRTKDRFRVAWGYLIFVCLGSPTVLAIVSYFTQNITLLLVAAGLLLVEIVLVLVMLSKLNQRDQVKPE